MKPSARTARQIIKARRAEAKAHRSGLHTLTSHAIRAGVAEADAAGVGNAIRSKAKTLGICGHTALMVRKTAAGVRPVKGAKRYTRSDVAQMLTSYNPRAAKYVAAKAQLTAYVGS
ncbi:hypothetical protein SEA_YDN12_39 [Streptomyces phage YDN12]|uniref:Uncharacterized protein n=1 Tax=Streptomyces phage YDN12 TaxID=1636183 RepID=A0A0E3M1J3_9CAUD|nr:hypothetical protein AVT63_gp38 [Streptomyces phage YDN12]AKA61706.1 hypothetical protein SEA_YDN12_39 [Streptomyces phage YDN12]